MTPPIRMVSVPVEWHREDDEHCRLIYSLIQRGWRKGQPVMVNDVMIRIEACNGSDTDIGPITDAIQAALTAAPVREEGGAVEGTGAKAIIRNGQIVISIDVDALPLILSGSIALNAVAGTFKVTDAAIFAKEVCYALNAEKEDGTTRVHMMFDSAFNHAIDQGAEGVEEISEDEFETEAARLQEEARSALATREEAPEEAGELQGAIAFMEGAAVMLGRGEMPAPGSQYAAAWWKAHAAVLSAIRAQPKVREEAQPVAVTIFCPECGLPHVDEGEWATTRHHKTHQCQGCGHEWRPFPFATVGVPHGRVTGEDMLAIGKLVGSQGGSTAFEAWQRIKASFTTPPAPEADKLRERVRAEIKLWTDTQFPKGNRVGSAKWVNGLTNRVLAALQQEVRPDA